MVRWAVPIALRPKRQRSLLAVQMTTSQPPTFAKLGINALFPTFLFCKDYPESEALNGGLMELGYAIRAADVQGRQISNRGGWQSDDGLQSHKETRPLIRFVEDAMLEIKEFVGAADDVHFYVASCWININGKGSHNASHIHGNSYFSGVYYVTTPPESGRIIFTEPLVLREYFHVPYKEGNLNNAYQQGFEPVPGRTYIFPAYLPHHVTENTVDDDRISVAFNISARP